MISILFVSNVHLCSVGQCKYLNHQSIFATSIEPHNANLLHNSPACAATNPLAHGKLDTSHASKANQHHEQTAVSHIFGCPEFLALWLPKPKEFLLVITHVRCSIQVFANLHGFFFCCAGLKFLIT